ncbi:hypothetical protein AB1Y20_000505 [Prymnesium parvum]|uniref:Methyltransferase type 12 domain-containing protein n=1 Tax=Prymnesium parvum TaxID=97485 RepID=A0AB34K9P4_PRYPA
MRAATVERWRADRLDRRVREVRERARHLPAEADPDMALQHNTWDDVEIEEEQRTRAEAEVRSQHRAPPAVAEACVREAALRWDAHYLQNIRNYHDRKYLHNEFPPLRAPLGKAVILETGCGVGNTLLPLLAAHSAVRLVGCDLSPFAVRCVNERLEREGLAARGRAFVWDIAAPPPVDQLQPHMLQADLVLAVFTLSAISPDRLGTAFSNLYDSLRPGGRLLIRDYGRLDSKQLKFCRAPNGRLGGEDGLEWYCRGDGTTVVFFTLDAILALATQSGFEVEDLRYDRRLMVNRAQHTRLYRVWVVAVLRKPMDNGKASKHTTFTSRRLPHACVRLWGLATETRRARHSMLALVFTVLVSRMAAPYCIQTLRRAALSFRA